MNMLSCSGDRGTIRQSLQFTVFILIQAGSHIQAMSLIQAGSLTAFVPIQVGHLIEARV